MDIKVRGPHPTEAERLAVDAVLGQAVSAWAGGKRDLGREGRISLLGGSEARAERHLLLPALHAVQDRFGWLPPGAIAYICQRLTIPPAEAHGVATFYHLFTHQSGAPIHVHVCDDIACRHTGGLDLLAQLKQQHTGSKVVEIHSSPCLGLCERAPAALVLRSGKIPQGCAVGHATSDTVAAALPADTFPDAGMDWLLATVPQQGQPGADLALLARVGRGDPASLADYQATAGYAGLRASIALGGEKTIAEVTTSGIVGRGGAAFPTGRKWDAVARATDPVRYVVCNADESEPGTFKDRLLMEGDPFALVEGMTIAGVAVGARQGFLYIRGEYPLAIRRMQGAIDQAVAAHLLGDNILGSGHDFHITIRRGAGAYICGEETALFNSIEGQRGEPRNKPPFPVLHGLFNQPTVINNVETLANIPLILRQGGAVSAALGTPGSKGRKLFCVSGHVARPGVYEFVFGITLRQLISQAGGVPGNRPIQAVLLGGAAGGFVGPAQLDVPLTLEGTRAIGASLGSGVVMVFDDSADLGDTLARIAAFFRDESCGQCVPCRVGVTRQEELVGRLRHGQTIGSPADELALLEEIGQVMRDASICGLGHTASSALQSALRLFGPGILAEKHA
ncbi:MAG: NAD(P)H-dependent oxidoreductase subunit E [Planctomycetota bacterium]|nr:NAD(P)H-dependent oxidoreductase subunit E [Planctomycetota bacterium]